VTTSEGTAPSTPAGYWPSRWPGEDGGPRRTQAPAFGPGLDVGPGEGLEVTSREVIAATMVVQRDPGELYLLRHTAGDDAVAWVERVDPVTLDEVERSPDLPGGPTWPGGVAVHENGSLYVVFGRHAHRLDPDCAPLASQVLPRVRSYNSFVIVPGGWLVTKDFGKDGDEPAELVVLDPEELEIVSRVALPERSIARLSADGRTVHVVGDTSLLRVDVAADGTATLDDGFRPRYRTLDGQTYGWDAVLDGGAAWFLDNGEGSERYQGSFIGQGISSAPLHLVRVDAASGAVDLTEVCGLAGGIIANPPVVDPDRRIAVGYDSSNGALAGFRFGDPGEPLEPLWRRSQNHAGHLVRYPDTGELVTGDYDAERFVDRVVVLDIETGEEKVRADTGSMVQSVLFPAPGFGRDLYWVTFLTLSRLTVVEV